MDILKNTYLDKYINNREDKYGKIYLKATPNDNFTISLISSILKKNDGGATFNILSASRYKRSSK